MAALPSLPLYTAQTQQEFFATVKQAAHGLLPAILHRLLPGGRVQGGEYVVRNPRRHDRTPGSFKIRVHGTHAGAWADFATGERGRDVISLVAFIDNVSQSEAARRISAHRFVSLSKLMTKIGPSPNCF